ncbi:Uncharacterised protein [Vibrio cholerae]|nr:hypothetical protein ASZ86_03013 [Vibrio cholerae]CSA17825.1 Uncharacterised protein [Vibrio cholerae]
MGEQKIDRYAQMFHLFLLLRLNPPLYLVVLHVAQFQH